MNRIFVRLTAAVISLLVVSTVGLAGPLDDFYLQKFGEPTSSALQKAVLFQQQETVDAPHCGTPLKHGLQRDWNLLEPATRKTLAKQLAAPLPDNAPTFTSLGGRYKIHYVTTGPDAPPLTDANANGVPDWVETVAQTFDDVATAYVARGWNLAPTSGGAPYDVYLRDLAPQGLFGQTTSTQSLASPGFANAFGSFIEIDKSFTDPKYVNASGGPYTSLQSLQITAAHEYHHAIQYGYNFFFDIWYAEATATWQEDELYDGVNQLYNYVPAWFSNSTLSLDTAVSTTTGGGYGRWIFNRYLSETHGTGVIKSIWEKLATINSPGNNTDIPMVPVLENLLLTSAFNSSLGTDFFGFTKRVYLRDWTSHSPDIFLIHPYSPVATVSTFPNSTIDTLAHYAFAFYKFTPSATVPALTLTLNRTSGIQTALFKSIGGVTAEINANSDGSYTVAGFGSLSPANDEVVLLIVNSTDVENHQASFSTNGIPPAVSEPGTSTGGGGGGGGCFIATAAYGSYLHPQVQVLRDFRDHYLLTNAPGRAFVAFYYRVSPPIANVISRHETLRMLVRLLLAPVIFIISNLMLTILVSGTALTGLLIRRICLNVAKGPVSG